MGAAPAIWIEPRHPGVGAVQAEQVAHVAGAQPSPPPGIDEGIDGVPGESIGKVAVRRKVACGAQREEGAEARDKDGPQQQRAGSEHQEEDDADPE
jgi:hypothetical protein